MQNFFSITKVGGILLIIAFSSLLVFTLYKYSYSEDIKLNFALKLIKIKYNLSAGKENFIDGEGIHVTGKLISSESSECDGNCKYVINEASKYNIEFRIEDGKRNIYVIR